MGGYGVVSNEETIDYSVHEAWNEATNVYLLVILVSFGLLMYARKNKRKIMRIFTLPPTIGSSPEPNFYDGLQKSVYGNSWTCSLFPSEKIRSAPTRSSGECAACDRVKNLERTLLPHFILLFALCYIFFLCK